MSILAEIAHRFRGVLSGLVDDPEPLLDLLRRSSDTRFGDYQANFAMPLAKRLGRPPREVAAEIAEGVALVQGLCDELAVPGLSSYGMTRNDLSDVVAKAMTSSSMKGNPIELTEAELTDLLRRAL